jgi:hypothetical protein
MEEDDRESDRDHIVVTAKAAGDAEGSDRALAANSPIAAYASVAEKVEFSDVITLYDRQHLVTYARLLDADRHGIDWREGAQIILLQDPETQPKRVWRCWDTHLARAKWIATTGFQQEIDRITDSEPKTVG